MARRSNGSKFTTIVAYILILLVLLAAIGFIYRLTNGGTDDFKTFYVTDENDNVYATNDTATLKSNTETKFYVHYLIEQNEGYTVKIVPNITTDTKFYYTMDGDEMIFKEGLDLSEAFSLTKYDDYFTIVAPFSMSAILTTVSDGQVVVTDDINPELAYFNLVVTSSDGESNTTIGLICTDLVANSSGLVLSPNRIIF
jgi:hypothetical protein